LTATRSSTVASVRDWLERHPFVLPAVVLVVGAIFRFYNLNWDDGHQLHTQPGRDQRANHLSRNRDRRRRDKSDRQRLLEYEHGTCHPVQRRVVHAGRERRVLGDLHAG